MKKRNKKAQVWIETVIYTLIGLVILGLVLALIQPKIAQIKDRTVIEQTIEALDRLDTQVLDVKINGPGNVRTPEVTIKKGVLYIDAVAERIYFEVEDSKVIYSEPGEKINIGNIEVLTEVASENSKRAKITLTLDYSEKDIDFKYDGAEDIKKFYPASVPYKISIENIGGTPTQLNIMEI